MSWDDIVEWFINVWDWMLDVGERIMDLFSNVEDLLGEISLGGISFGISSLILIFLLRGWMLVPFLEYMNPFNKIFWEVITYVCSFILGYFIGKRIFDD